MKNLNKLRLWIVDIGKHPLTTRNVSGYVLTAIHLPVYEAIYRNTARRVLQCAWLNSRLNVG